MGSPRVHEDTLVGSQKMFDFFLCVSVLLFPGVPLAEIGHFSVLSYQKSNVGIYDAKWLVGVISALPTETRSHPPPVLVLLSLPQSFYLLPTLKLGRELSPFETVANGTGCSEGKKVSGDGTGMAAEALGSPLFVSAAGGGTEVKRAAAEPPPRTSTFVQGSASARCFLPSLFADGVMGSNRLFRLRRGQSGARLYLGRRSRQHPAPALGKGGGASPGVLRRLRCFRAWVIFPGSTGAVETLQSRGPATGRWFVGFGGVGAAPSPWCFGLQPSGRLRRCCCLRWQSPASPLFSPANAGIASVCCRGGVPTQALPPAPHSQG